MDCFDAAARYMATEPESVARALAAHLADSYGRCTACGPAVRWPCAVAVSAGRARTLLDAGPPAPVGGAATGRDSGAVAGTTAHGVRDARRTGPDRRRAPRRCVRSAAG